MKKSEEIDGVPIKGHDFNKGADLNDIFDSFASSGFQATHLAKAVELIKKMRKENCTIYLGYTSNMVTSGLRDVFRYLAEHKLVDVIVTTAGGVEEDFIKCFAPFLVGDFEAKGADLRERGINRTGNIFIPNSRYCAFEKFLIPLFEKMTEEQNKTNHIITPSEFTDRLGKEINNKDSIYYWCHKNKIPVFCPAIIDGSIGDMVYFFKTKHPEFAIDMVEDVKKLNDITCAAEKTAVIILGAGLVKHHILNTNLVRNGCEYAVYLNNAQEFDGSDAGARPDEAITWGKIKIDGEAVKVFGDATILFPLIVAKAFMKN